MRILLDAMGGDNAPLEIIKGAIQAAADESIELVLIGRESEMKKCIAENGLTLPENVVLVHAEGVVTMEDDPLKVVKERSDSSMITGLHMLKDGEVDAFISAGSTGALMTASTLIVKRIRGIRRAAIAIEFPTAQGGTTLIVDCGANAECTPEYLMQFAFMGASYMENLRGIKSPRVGLLNIGEEDSKGTELQKETYKLLLNAKKNSGMNFTGNVEARYVEQGAADVIVTDGYSGNILLKTTEGVAMYMTSMLKDVFIKNLPSKLCYMVLKSGLKEFKKKMDYTEYGGTPLLGLTKPVIKAHGSSNAKAISSAVNQAKIFVESDVIGKITENAGSMK